MGLRDIPAAKCKQIEIFHHIVKYIVTPIIMIDKLLLYLPCKYHIEAETNWPTFFRRNFQMNFLQWKSWNSEYILTEVCS